MTPTGPSRPGPPAQVFSSAQEVQSAYTSVLDPGANEFIATGGRVASAPAQMTLEARLGSTFIFEIAWSCIVLLAS
jgi:hypothetical protein